MTTEQRELPSGWKWVKLGDIAQIIRGVTFKTDSSSKTYVQDWIPILRAGNITKKLITDNDLIWVLPNLISNQQLLSSEDIVICMSSGSSKIVGKTASLKYDWLGSVGAFCGIIRGKDKTIGKYLSCWFQSNDYFKWRDVQTTGTNIQNLRINALRDISIPLPPQEMQKRIAEILNKAEEIKKLKDEADKKTEELIPAIFHEMVGSRIKKGEELPADWKWVKLEDISDIILGQSPPSSTYRKSPDGLPFFQGKADFGDINPTPTTWCIAPKKIAESGDILMSVRAPVGPTNLADRKCAIGRGLASIRCNEKINRDFLRFNLKLIEHKISNMGEGRGSVFSSITGKQLKEFLIPLPQLEEQNQITIRLNEAEEIKKTNAQSDKKIEELKSSLLQRAFRGEL